MWTDVKGQVYWSQWNWTDGSGCNMGSGTDSSALWTRLITVTVPCHINNVMLYLSALIFYQVVRFTWTQTEGNRGNWGVFTPFTFRFTVFLNSSIRRLTGCHSFFLSVIGGQTHVSVKVKGWTFMCLNSNSPIMLFSSVSCVSCFRRSAPD